MIPRTKEIDVTDRLGDGQRQAFTIEANAKAFRTLIDNLYSNKVQSIVRELWSNAYDSHIEAGKADVPFECDIPTARAPVFRVRDFGVGLSHEDVMSLYTTIFRSSKEETNDSVGMLGLGSKSPFAYTDSFSVSAYDGKTKRNYVASIADTGVPTIVHIDTRDCDEPRGLEVQFAVQRNDFARFAEAAGNVSLGFDTKPIVTGANLKQFHPIINQENWLIGRVDHTYGVQIYVRQGCVLYPVRSSDGFDLYSLTSSIKNGLSLVIDVPIGSVDVAANREALSLDQFTIDFLKKTFENVRFSIKEYVDSQLPDSLNQYQRVCKKNELAKWYNKFDWKELCFNLLPDKFKYYHGEHHKNAGKYLLYRRAGRQYAPETFVEFKDVSGMMIVVDDGTEVKRKARRIGAYMPAGNRNRFIIFERKDSNLQDRIKRFKRLLGLRDDQFIYVKDLPDVEIAPKTPRDKKPVPGDGEYWVIVERDIIKLPLLHRESQVKYGFPGWIKQAFEYAGLPGSFHDVKYRYTAKEAERLKVPMSKRIDVALAEKVNSVMDIKSFLTYHALCATVNSSFIEVTMNKFFPDAVFDHYSYETWNLYAALYEHTDTINAMLEPRIKELQDKYPLLFPDADAAEAAIKYIEMMEVNS